MPDLEPIKPDALANIFIKKNNKLLGQKSEGDNNTDCLQLKTYVDGKVVPIKRVVKINNNGAVQNISKRLVEIYRYYSDISSEFVEPGYDPQNYSVSADGRIWLGWIKYEAYDEYGSFTALSCGSGGKHSGDYAFGQYQFDIGYDFFGSEDHFLPFAYKSYPDKFSGFYNYLSYNKKMFWDNEAKEPLKELFREYARNYPSEFLWCQNQVFIKNYLTRTRKNCSKIGFPESYLNDPYIFGTLCSMAVRQGPYFDEATRLKPVTAAIKELNNAGKTPASNLTEIIRTIYNVFGEARANGQTMDQEDEGRWANTGPSYSGECQRDRCLRDIGNGGSLIDLDSDESISYSILPTSEILSFINSPIIASVPEDFNYYSIDPGISFYINVTFRFKRNVNTNSDINIASNLSSIERSGYRLYIDRNNILTFDLISKNGTIYRKTFMKLDEDTSNNVNVNSGKWYNVTVEKRKNGPVIKLKNGTIEPGKGQEILNNKEFKFSNEGGRQFKFGDVDSNQNSIVSFKDKIVFCGADQSGLIEDLCTVNFSNSTINSGVLHSSTA